MATHQSKIAIADGGPVVTNSRRPPMTSKQAKKAFAKANNMPKMSWKERRRMEAAELAAQKREFEREKAQAKARAMKAKKDAKEEAEKAERKKAGIPEKSRWVRPSQGRITGFLGLGKRGRSKVVDEEEEGGETDNDCEEPVSKRVAVDEAEGDTEEEDMEEREDDIPEVPAIKTLCDIDEREEDAQPDEHEPLEEVSVVVTERKNSPEAEPEAEIQQDPEELEVEVKRELVVRSEPEVQSEPELERDEEECPAPEFQATPKVQAEPANEEEQEVLVNPEVTEDPKVHGVLDVQTEAEVHAVSRLDDPKLPTNSQYVTSSQDFMDDDDIFLELAAAHQLLSESFDAGVRSQAAAQSSPVLTAKEVIRPLSSPKQQSVSPILERTPRPRMEFACSGVSPELTSSNPFSQKQSALRSMSKTVSKSNTAAAASVMGPPTSIVPPRPLSTPIRSQTKNMPAPRANNSLPQRTVRGFGTDGSSHRRPLNDISKHAQNVQPEVVASSTRSKPLLKPSLLPTHKTPKVSPFDLPPSTQFFLANHLDDFFPSPSQELRELLEDIEDDDIPSNTQVAREIGRESVVVRSTLVEPAQPVLDEDFSWMSSQNFMFSSQELRELESPSKISPVPAPPPTPWDVRRARKPRFFVEKEEDLFAAAIHESELQGKLDAEAAKLRLENMRIERELLGTRQSPQRYTPSARQPSQDASRLDAGEDDVSEQLEGLNASELMKLMDGIESDEYGDDFDDEEVEASMIAFGHKLENPFARDCETETESEKYDDFIDDFLMDDAHANHDYGCI
ncbi:hypothetical protein V494_03765 [Pseudogymnoascus sp. VKM F-4513 (FW-928)]|nr:hypothetical protein V494_03765 [Pseudogymnoascus sp. VKM F-4513 (FW-928)]